jgi:hypothetical protein
MHRCLKFKKQTKAVKAPFKKCTRTCRRRQSNWRSPLILNILLSNMQCHAITMITFTQAHRCHSSNININVSVFSNHYVFSCQIFFGSPTLIFAIRYYRHSLQIHFSCKQWGSAVLKHDTTQTYQEGVQLQAFLTLALNEGDYSTSLLYPWRKSPLSVMDAQWWYARAILNIMKKGQISDPAAHNNRS